MKTLYTYVTKHKKILIFGLVLAALNQIFSLLDPQIFRIIIDSYASKVGEISGSEFLRGVSILLLASVGTAFISRTAKAFQDYYVNVTVQRVGTQMYADSVNHSFSLPYAVFEDQRSGELLGKLQKARTDSQNFLMQVINVLFFSMVGIIFVLIYAFWVHWLIGMVYFLLIPVLGIIIFYLSRKIKEIQQRIVRETTSLAGSTTETLRNVELVKSLGLERQEIERLNLTNEKILGLELDKVKLVRRLDYIQGTTINALRSSLLLLMLWLIYTRAITLGEFFSLWFYSFAIFFPLGQLGIVASAYQEARASVGQLEAVLALKPEEDQRNLPAIGPLQSIRYNDVSFSYSPDKETLKHVDIEIIAGETVAFVGPSGSGKSTLVKLIAGLYRPTQGEILFNGKNGADIDFDNLRNRIGMVAQETQLFAGTIRENLLFVNPAATDEECKEALRQSAALSVIERSGEGLDTKIGEGGIKLSGGERQRLAIARALLRKPEVLIFDEATSSLDSITEKSITDTIKGIIKERPELVTVMIAHRLSTVVHADVIYVLEKGRVVQKGKHTELVAQDGLYGALWRQQTAAEEVV